MGGWGRQRTGFYHREQQGSRSHNRKPPVGNWQPTLPVWEKQFCSSVGSLSWQKFLENKKYIFLYDNVMQWDDSAGEEAFNNAKRRFWAQMNNVPCDISLPDPDAYIDEIDWDSNVDPELLLELETESKGQEGSERRQTTNDLSFLWNQPVECTGWDDDDDDEPKAGALSSEVKVGASNGSIDRSGNSWELNPDRRSNGYMEDNSWGNSWTYSGKWNQKATIRNEWEHTSGMKYESDARTGRDWSRKDENFLHERSPNRYTPNHRARRIHGNYSQENRGSRSKREPKKGYHTEQRFQGSKPPSRKWDLSESAFQHGPKEPGNSSSSARPPLRKY